MYFRYKCSHSCELQVYEMSILLSHTEKETDEKFILDLQSKKNQAS